jgi:hypothetical protein
MEFRRDIGDFCIDIECFRIIEAFQIAKYLIRYNLRQVMLSLSGVLCTMRIKRNHTRNLMPVCPFVSLAAWFKSRSGGWILMKSDMNVMPLNIPPNRTFLFPVVANTMAKARTFELGTALALLPKSCTHSNHRHCSNQNCT